MTFKIDKRLVESELDNPTFKTINHFVQQHEQLLPRLEMLADYYEGLPHKINEKSNVQTPHEKGQVFVNNAKYVTDIMVGITLGNPIAYSSPSTDTTAEQESNDDTFDVILENFDRINISRHDKELEKDLSVFGVGYELFYGSIVNAYDEVQAVTKQTVKPCVTVIDPRGVFLIVDDTVDQEKLFAVRYKQKTDLDNQEYWEFNVFTKTQVISIARIWFFLSCTRSDCIRLIASICDSCCSKSPCFSSLLRYSTIGTSPKKCSFTIGLSNINSPSPSCFDLL